MFSSFDYKVIHLKIFIFAMIILINSCISTSDSEDDDGVSYINNWKPNELDGESFDFMSELRSELRSKNYPLQFIPSDDFKSESFDMIFEDQNIRGVKRQDGTTYKVSESLGENLKDWLTGEKSTNKIKMSVIVMKNHHDSGNSVLAVAIDGGPFFKN